MTAAAVILNSLRPFTQILREMINDESFCLNTRRSIWARIYIYIYMYIHIFMNIPRKLGDALGEGAGFIRVGSSGLRD